MVMLKSRARQQIEMNPLGERKRTDFVVDATLQVAHIDPTLLLLHLRVVVQNLVSQPRQVIHSQLVLFTCNDNN